MFDARLKCGRHAAAGGLQIYSGSGKRTEASAKTPISKA